jgi:phospholipid/cholesterol/gamma-HCH transport system permease protein
MPTRTESKKAEASSNGNGRAPAGGVVLGPAAVARKTGGMLDTVGNMVRFSGEVVGALPTLVRRYPSEFFRQGATIVTSSAAILWFMYALSGVLCGLNSGYLADQIGAPAFSGVANIMCIRYMGPMALAYIFAAKVGCGYVAEIGSMRISDELDALEVMGVSSKAYVIASRLLGVWITVPFLVLVGLQIHVKTAEFMDVKVLSFLSQGQFTHGYWNFQEVGNLFVILSIAMVMTTTMTLVCCYYGFASRGGPVGVGMNTAKSMVLNVVLGHLLHGIGILFFFGPDGKFPVAN